MTQDDLQRNKPYHHTNMELLGKVMNQIKKDLDNADLNHVCLLLDYIPKKALESFLLEEE